jgi:hypothetical protein
MKRVLCTLSFLAACSNGTVTTPDDMDAGREDALAIDAEPGDTGPGDAGDPCLVNNGGCAPNATCTSTTGSVQCRCPLGSAGDGRTCIDVAASLSGLRWEIPCTGPNQGNNVCSAPGPVQTSTVLAGQAGRTYDVTLRFRGVIEQHTYTGGTNDGAYFQIGGVPSADGFNVYELDISDPPSTYYLNRGMSFIYWCFPIDYTATIPMAAGATVTLRGDARDGAEIVNTDPNNMPIVIPDIPPAPAAYDGQFIQMDVRSVVPR